MREQRYPKGIVRSLPILLLLFTGCGWISKPPEPPSPAPPGCGSVSAAGDGRLAEFGVDPRWELQRGTAVAEVQGTPGHLLVVFTSWGLENPEVLTLGNLAVESLPTTCGVFPIDEGTYRIQVRGRFTLTEETDRVKVLRLPSPEVLQDRLADIRDLVDSPSTWAQGNPRERLERLTELVEAAFLHTYALQRLGIPGGPGLPEHDLADMLEEPLRHLSRQPAAVGYYGEMATAYGRLARAAAGFAGAAGGFDAVSTRLGCLEAHALARHVVNLARALPSSVSREAATRVDGILDRFEKTLAQSDCKCQLSGGLEFPEAAVRDAVAAMIDAGIGYARADFCDSEDRHLSRIQGLNRFLDRLDRTCWIDDPQALRAHRDRLSAFERDLEETIRIKDGQPPRILTDAEQDLKDLESRLGTSMSALNEEAVSRLETDLRRLEVPSGFKAPIEGDCVRFGLRQIEARSQQLGDHKKALTDRIVWFRGIRTQQRDRGELPWCSEVRTAHELDEFQREIYCAAVERSIDGLLAGGDCGRLEQVDQYLRCEPHPCPEPLPRLRRFHDGCKTEVAVAETQHLLAEQAPKGTCDACEAMARRMERLKQEAPGAAQALDGEYRRRLTEARENLWRNLDAARDCARLDPRRDSRGSCCELPEFEMEARVAQRTTQCCQQLATDLREETGRVRRDMDRLRDLDRLSWQEFTNAVESVERWLGELPQRMRSHSTVCTLELDSEIEQWRIEWSNLRRGAGGLFEQLLLLVSGEGSPFTDPQPDVGRVLQWTGRRAEHYEGYQDWHKLLDLQWKVRRVVAECPTEGNLPSSHTRDLYESLSNDERHFGQWFSGDLLARAGQILQDAKNCMSAYEVRTVTVILDARASFHGPIDPELYEITSGGRLLEIRLLKRQRLVDPGLEDLTNVSVEFFARGFTVSPATSEGAPDNSPDRSQICLGETRDGFRTFCFREVWVAEGRENRMYYRVVPSSQEREPTLILHVVPRSF